MLTHTELWFIRVDNSTRQSPLLLSCVVALSGNGADVDFKRIRCMKSWYLILLESGRSHRTAWGRKFAFTANRWATVSDRARSGPPALGLHCRAAAPYG